MVRKFLRLKIMLFRKFITLNVQMLTFSSICWQCFITHLYSFRANFLTPLLICQTIVVCLQKFALHILSRSFQYYSLSQIISSCFPFIRSHWRNSSLHYFNQKGFCVYFVNSSCPILLMISNWWCTHRLIHLLLLPFHVL